MKNLVLSVTLLLMTTPALAGYWYAEARSGSALGYGMHVFSRSQAERNALVECAMRTPYYDRCSITKSYYHR